MSILGDLVQLLKFSLSSFVVPGSAPSKSNSAHRSTAVHVARYGGSPVHVRAYMYTCTGISWRYRMFFLLLAVFLSKLSMSDHVRSLRTTCSTTDILTIHHWHQSNCAFGQNLQLMWSDFVETHLLPSIPGTFPLIEVLVLSTLPPTLSTRRSRRPSKHGGMEPRSSFPSNRNTSRWGMLHVVDST